MAGIVTIITHLAFDQPLTYIIFVFSVQYNRFLCRLSERLSELRSVSTGGLFRPRFLHPLYAGVNPFDADLDDPQREQIYDSDMITTVTPNHRIQVWDISSGVIPVISNRKFVYFAEFV